MARWNTLSFIPPTLIAATFLVATCAVPSARAAEPPADLCSLLPAGDVSKGLGRTYDSPQKSLAPRPFANTATGTDCKYPPQGATRGELWFRAYVDPSASVSADLFSKLSKFYGPPTAVSGLGDEAYFDANHALHVRKGNVRFYINLDLEISAAEKEKQIKELRNRVAGRL